MRRWQIKAVSAVVGVLVLVACGGNVSPEEQALLAAKGYYEHLLSGEYEDFLEGKAGADSLPADYREQLLAACKQYVFKQRDEHGGIREIQAGNATADTAKHVANAFLLLCYGDSTTEEIVVPMVERDGKWRMR